VFEEVVEAPGAAWVQVRFGPETVLPGSSVGEEGLGGPGAFLRITSWQDGAEQTLYSDHLRQWRNTSAYFNGDAVTVALVSPAGSGPARVQVVEVIAGDAAPLGERTICGSLDGRERSSDPRIARLLPAGCTAWLIDDAGHGFLSAGHCADPSTGARIVEFNVPLSTATGLMVHPPPEDQYAVDPASLQVAAAPIEIGNDWSYFGAFANPDTGLTPYEAQQDGFVLLLTQPAAAGQTLRVTGYGAVDPLQGPMAWSFVQKTHTGPLTDVSGTTLHYRVDTSAGNSGSPVIDEESGRAIGIHTTAGCTEAGGSNSATALSHEGLHRALANPRGVCAQACPADRDGNHAADVMDLLSYLDEWFAHEETADLDRSGSTGVSDLLMYLDAWFAGCG
jgi:V8-like Glu-specific endopeptidase